MDCESDWIVPAWNNHSTSLSFSAKYHLSYGWTRPAYTSWLLQVETHRVLWMWQLCFIQSHWLYVPCMQPSRAFILRCLDCPLLIGKESPCWLIKNYPTGHCWPLSHTHICTMQITFMYALCVKEVGRNGVLGPQSMQQDAFKVTDLSGLISWVWWLYS